MADILSTFVELIFNVLHLVVEIGDFALNHILLIAWIAWWLFGVNWNKASVALARGGWIVLVLLSIIAALAWSAMFPSSLNLFDQFTMPNFWWQLGAVWCIILSALLCGWVQGVFGWAPEELDLDPPTHSHGEHAHANH